MTVAAPTDPNRLPPPLFGRPGVEFLWSYLIAHQGRAWPTAPDAEALRFIASCLARLGRSHAQLFQDCYVAHKLGDKRSGFFVEFGATDGVQLSNTCMLERDLGWTGILAEPFPHWHRALARNRTARIDHRCVWRSTGQELEFLATPATPELAGLEMRAYDDLHAAVRRKSGERIRVRTVSLTDLLREHGAPRDFDYLSVDVEGAEYDILEAFDFDAFRPRIVTVEHNFSDAQRRDIHSLLSAHGFVRELEALSQFDDWYYHPQRVS